MKYFSSMYSAIAVAVERSVNTLLKYDPSARSKLQAVNGKSLQIEISDLGIFIHLSSGDEGNLHLKVLPEGLHSDARLRGTFKQYIFLTTKSQHSLADTGIALSGSAHILEIYTDVFTSLDLDWEDALSPILEPAAIQTVSMLASVGFNKVKSNIEYLSHTTQRYIQDELKLLVDEEHAAHFYSRIADTRSHVDRLEARFTLLQKTLSEQTNT